MSSLTCLQERTEIVSAIRIIFGLDIAKSKLRSFVHSLHAIQRASPLSFVIYTSGWVRHSVPTAATGSLKSLGMLYDDSTLPLHQTQDETTKLKVERTCHIIQRARGSRVQLSTVVSTCIAKRAAYMGKLAAWTQSQTDDIEKICTQTYKKLTQNHYSFLTP